MATQYTPEKDTFFLNPDNALRYQPYHLVSDKVIEGQITTCCAEQQSEDQFLLRIGYNFPDPNGADRKKRGTVTILRHNVHQMLLPKPGTPVLILYRGRDNHTVL